MSKEELLDTVKLLGKMLETERSLHQGTLDIMRASRYCGPSGDL